MASLAVNTLPVWAPKPYKAVLASDLHTMEYSESEYSSSNLSLSSSHLETESETETVTSIKSAELEFEEIQFLQSITRAVLKKVRNAAQIGLEEELAIFKDPTCNSPPSAIDLEHVTSRTIQTLRMSAPAVVFALVYLNRALHECIDGRAPGCVVKNIWQGCLLLSAQLHGQNKLTSKIEGHAPMVVSGFKRYGGTVDDVNKRFMYGTLGLLKGQVRVSRKEFKDTIGVLISFPACLESDEDDIPLKKSLERGGVEGGRGKQSLKAFKMTLTRFRVHGRGKMC